MIQDVEKIIDLTGSNQFKKLFRINYGGYRLYVNPDPFNYYSGLTGALSKATFQGDPAQQRLKGWRESMIDQFGQRNATEYVQMTADFGTLLHQALVTIKEKEVIDWAEETDKANEYFHELFAKTESDSAYVIRKTTYEYLKHVASMMQFIHERVEKIYAIEVPVIWDELKIATPIDLVCLCRQTPKGEYSNTVINVKTSKQITPHHMEQVSCELTMWNQTYDIECEHAGIMRTKDWTEGKAPTYDYKYLHIADALDKSGQAFQRLNLCLQSDASYFPSPQNKRFEGTTKVGEQPVITVKNLSEDWAEYWTNEQ